MKQEGDEVQLGDTLSLNDTGQRWGRVVGLRKDDCRAMERIIVRTFRDGDGWFPTGHYRTTWLAIAYRGEL